MFDAGSPSISKKRSRESHTYEDSDGKYKKLKIEDSTSSDFNPSIHNNSNEGKNVNENDDNISIRNLVEPVCSEIYKSELKNTFLNFIWKLILNSIDFFSNFRRVEKFEARQGIYCSLLIDYLKKENDISFAVLIGERNLNIENEFIKEKLKIRLNQNQIIGSENGDEIIQKLSAGNNSIDETNTNQIFYIVNVKLNLINRKNVTFTLKLQPNEISIFIIKISDELFNYITSSKEVIIVNEVYVNKIRNENVPYLGLINEGMTCYMNSMLQTLNTLSYFKKAVFQIPIQAESEFKSSVAYSLQKLFYDLMTESTPISTIQLIKSFGWGKEQLLVQHDVQEFNIILSEHLEKKMENTKVEGTFRYLFEGKANNYIQCLEVDYKSNKTETFNFIPLNVKGCADIYQSFDKYTEVEILDGENKYETEIYGKQIANKGIKFLLLPNVLILQLKRFEYNFQRDMMEKVNDKFEFYNQVDLNRYLVESNSDNDNIYSLHSVMVHLGSPHAGHYYTFIKVNDRWIKFNDEIVRYVEEYEVFQNNFGGYNKIFKYISGNFLENENLSDSNAYVLVYIKNKMRDTILFNITIDDVPENLKKLLIKDKNDEINQLQILQRHKSNVNVGIFTKDILVKFSSTLGLIPSPLDKDPKIFFPQNCLTINVPREMPIKEFINLISTFTNIPVPRIKLFKFAYRKLNSILKRSNYSMLQIDDNLIQNSQILNLLDESMILMVYLHIIKDGESGNINKILTENENYKKELESETEFISNMNTMTNDDEITYKLNDPNTYAYISVSHNYWKFNFNNTPAYNENTYSDNYVLCIIKYLCSNRTTNSSLSFVVDDVIELPKSECLDTLKSNINFAEKYKSYIDIDDYTCSQIVNVTFLIEFTSLPDDFYNKIVINKLTYSVRSDLPVKGFKNDAICLIVNLEWSEKVIINNRELTSLAGLINEKALEILSTIYVEYNFYNQNDKNSNERIYKKGEKQLVNLIKSEDFLKENIIATLDESVIRDILNIKETEYYILSTEQKLQNIYEFINCYSRSARTDLIELKYNNNEKEKDYNHYVKDFPILKYLTSPLTKKINGSSNEIRIYFGLNFISRELFKDFIFFDLVLFDIHNNPLAKIGICLPRLLQSCSEIIEYLDKLEILSFFYPKLHKNSFYFLIQNPNTHICYEVFIDKSVTLRFYEKYNSIIIEYRLQPYSNDEISSINYANKIYVSVCDKDNHSICHPFVVFIDLEITNVFKLKSIILEKLRKIKQLQSYEENGDFNNLSRLKFYTSDLDHYKPVKKNLILSTKDEELLSIIYDKSTTHNLLIELPSRIQNSCGIIIN